MAAPDFIFLEKSQGTITNPSSVTQDDFVLGSHPLYGSLIEQSGKVEFDVSSQSLAAGWLFTYIEVDYQDADQPILTLAGATTDLLRIVAVNTVSTSGGSQRLEYYNGTGWTSAGTLTTNLQTTAHRVDINWDITNTGGTFEIFINGVSEASFTGDTLTTADTTIDFISQQCPDGAAIRRTWHGPLVVDSADTRDLEWDSADPTSQGTYNEWTAGEANVDNHPFETNGALTVASGDADTERCTLNFPAINAAYAGYAVESVCLVLWGKAQSEPSFYVKGHTRKSSTDYLSSTSFQLPASEDVAKHIQLDLDPSTASAWANQAAVEACEFGFEIDTTA